MKKTFKCQQKTTPKNWYVETQRVVTLLQLKSIQSCIRIPDLLLNSKKTKIFECKLFHLYILPSPEGLEYPIVIIRTKD